MAAPQGRGRVVTVLYALTWVFLCSAAGATPNRWHKPIAVLLGLAALPVLWLIGRDFGWPWVLGFILLGMYQFRLLLFSWARRIRRWLRGRGGS
ncbi:DUF2484 family protein [Halovulum dunhuangense]|uniref:DUF2484 family protein n=1 Tax=Halovulum dunhuangense TaxID=1505036 RepID=A0A849L182_9RHOB|nr:DUF2484 family protein [Halovulum dunhuangense]NNU80011.1 DUF2484 family protein [Halovulum dunhuangense]